MSTATLTKRNYTLILDKSGSMATPDQPGGMSRWRAAQESTLALAQKCEQFDGDGLTVYLFSGRFRRFEQVTALKVNQIFQEHDPSGTTNLAAVLQDAVNQYFQRRTTSQAQGETILVVTDGEPDDQKAVMKVIVEASRRCEREDELAISFIQVGNDPGATRFLKALDDQLTSAGAKFDLCDTVTLDEMEDMTLAEVLLAALQD